MTELPGGATPAPFHGFELSVAVDAPVYAAGQVVRIAVTASNDGPRAVEHGYPGWQRVLCTVRDERHRAVASDELGEVVPGVDRQPSGPFRDRWLPGQLLVLPTWWDQRAGALRPGWVPAVQAPGERLPAGRYRVRATWLGREPGTGAVGPEAWSNWFELV